LFVASCVSISVAENVSDARIIVIFSAISESNCSYLHCINQAMELQEMYQYV